MRWLVACLIWIVGWLAMSSEARAAPPLDVPSIPSPARLYLLAEGSRSAVAQQVLSAMCRMFARDSAGKRAPAFASVTLVLDPRDEALSAVTARKLASAANETQVDDLLHLFEGLRRTERQCLRDGVSATGRGGGNDPRTSVALLSVRVDDETKASAPVQAQVSLVVVDTQTKQKVSVSDPHPENIGQGEEIQNAARALGVKYLDLPRDRALSGAGEVSIAAEDRCVWGQKDASCTRLGGQMDLRFEMEDPIWIAPSALPATLVETCTGPSATWLSRRSLRFEVAKSAAASEKDLWEARIRVQARNLGACTYRVEASHRRIVYTSNEIAARVASSPVVFETFLGGVVNELKLTWFTRNWVPFYSERTNAPELDRRLRALSVLNGDDVVAEAAVARAELQAQHLPSVNEELNRCMEREIEERLNTEGDLLGYTFLEELLIGSGDYGPFIYGSALCRELTGKLHGLLAAQEVRASLSEWSSGCTGIMIRFADRVADKAKPTTALGFRWGESGRTVYRSIAALRNKSEALLLTSSPIFAPSHGEATRTQEIFMIQPISEHGRQGRPLRLVVRTEKRTPDFEVLVRRESLLWAHYPYEELTLSVAPILRFNFLNSAVAAEMSLRTYRYALKSGQGAMSVRGTLSVEPFRLLLVMFDAPPSQIYFFNMFQFTLGSGYDSYRNTIFLNYALDIGPRDRDFGISVGGVFHDAWHLTGPEAKSTEFGPRFTIRWTLY